MSPAFNLSRIGLGTGTLGTLGVSATPRQVGILLDTMIANQITVIDTADSYGSGHAERLLGKALFGRRQQFFLMTKAGYRYGDLPWPFHLANPFIKKGFHSFGTNQNFKPDYIHRCLHRSLKRLMTDYVDVFFLHDPSVADLDQPRLVAFLEKMRKSGVIRELGVSSGKSNVIRAAINSGWVTFIQCPANLPSIAKHQVELTLCEKHNIKIIANHVLGCGDFGNPELTHKKRIQAAAALLPKLAVILCGTKNPKHLIETHKWANEPLAVDSALKLLEDFMPAKG